LALTSVLVGAMAVAGAAIAADRKPTPPATTKQVAATQSCDIVRGKRVFSKCAICHSRAAGAASVVGPNLHGVVGRRAGTLKEFRFSPAMRKFGKVWSASELDAFLSKPLAHVQGTSMAFAGLANAADRTAVICLLESRTP
jgi:cytochrome c